MRSGRDVRVRIGTYVNFPERRVAAAVAPNGRKPYVFEMTPFEQDFGAATRADGVIRVVAHDDVEEVDTRQRQIRERSTTRNVVVKAVVNRRRGGAELVRARVVTQTRL